MTALDYNRVIFLGEAERLVTASLRDQSSQLDPATQVITKTILYE